MMDVAAYEQLRAGNHEVAAAQLVQNMKAKLQSVLQGGDWASAWLCGRSKHHTAYVTAGTLMLSTIAWHSQSVVLSRGGLLHLSKLDSPTGIRSTRHRQSCFG